MFVRYPAPCAPEANAGRSRARSSSTSTAAPRARRRPGFSRYAQLFVDAGFIFVEPNVRGSDGYGKAWLHADNGPKRLDVITDIEDAGKSLREPLHAQRQGAEGRRSWAAATAATRRSSA